MDWGEFAYQLRYHPEGGTEFPVLITTSGDRYLTFVSDNVQLPRDSAISHG